MSCLRCPGVKIVGKYCPFNDLHCTDQDKPIHHRSVEIPKLNFLNNFPSVTLLYRKSDQNTCKLLASHSQKASSQCSTISRALQEMWCPLCRVLCAGPQRAEWLSVYGNSFCCSCHVTQRYKSEASITTRGLERIQKEINYVGVKAYLNLTRPDRRLL